MRDFSSLLGETPEGATDELWQAQERIIAEVRVGGMEPRGPVRKEGALGSADTNRPAICSGNWDLLCVKCKILKPVRTKHCTVCDRCVSLYDHHSPWIGNCVGSRNRKDMILFLVLLTVAITAGALVASHRMWALGQMELGMTHAPALLMWLVGERWAYAFPSVSKWREGNPAQSLKLSHWS
eukprot:gene12039-biopygen12381